MAGDGVTDGIPEEWQYILDTNVKGYLKFSYEEVSRMKKQKSGHIINIGYMSQIPKKKRVLCMWPQKPR